MLSLLIVYFFYNFKETTQIKSALQNSILYGLPASIALGVIRFITRDRPHLGGAYHFPDNLQGIGDAFFNNPLDLYRLDYLHFILVFGVFWYFSFKKIEVKDFFIQRAMLLIPVFLVAHLITGIISEPRQMIPLAAIIIPAAFQYLFPEEGTKIS